ncbi:hypothetical protein [Actinomadura atramentaria]|uniref:hypothetical protein n=1 Tax=Actinomadura atramentaria TaxID=1990 RepID=UPI000371DCC6|nr:hypothetical protein [Actinomadura atramentaria]
MKRLIAAALLPGCLLASGCSSNASAKDATAHKAAAQAPAAPAAEQAPHPGANTVIAVRKDGHKITRAEFLKAAAKSNKRHPKDQAAQACKLVRNAFLKNGGKIADESAFARTCVEAFSNGK